nr:GNAT family N-acetyltransferase [Aquimarina sp. MMG016]
MASDYDNEYIVIAEINNNACGLGRLTTIDTDNLELGGIYVFDEFRGLGVADQIVTHLMSKASKNKKIWCLPFNHLKDFYLKFGFKDHSLSDYQIPNKITSKYQWCNKTYDKGVLLLTKLQVVT